MSHSSAHTNCLNCDAVLSGNYCGQCGQKATTHRLSLGHFIQHELVHGIWHVDKGFLFTLGQVLRRPGHVARDYIKGKRAGHFNLLTLLLLLISALLLLNHHQHTEPVKAEGDWLQMTEWIKHNFKWVMLCFLPIAAWSGQIVFRRVHYNFAEQLVFNCFVMSGELFILLCVALAERIPGTTWMSKLEIEQYLSLIFFLIAYWQMYGAIYTLPGWIWRVLAYLVLFMAFFIVAAFIAVAIYALLFNGGSVHGKIQIPY
jgi:hypothetical protein